MAINITFCQKCCLHFAHVLRLFVRLNLKVMGYLVEDISRQHSLQGVTWILLAAFSQVYSDNQEQRLECRDLKNLQFSQKSACKTGAKEVVVVKGTAQSLKKC